MRLSGSLSPSTRPISKPSWRSSSAARAKNVARQRALDHVLGYTIARGHQRSRFAEVGKAILPLPNLSIPTRRSGPFVYTEVETGDLEISLRQNGEIEATGAHEPDDLFGGGDRFFREPIAQSPAGRFDPDGTPSGVGPIRAGDELVASWRLAGVAATVSRTRESIKKSCPDAVYWACSTSYCKSESELLNDAEMKPLSQKRAVKDFDWTHSRLLCDNNRHSTLPESSLPPSTC